MSLVQTEDGKVLHRESRSRRLRIAKSYRVKLLYDYLGFRLFLGPRLILSAPDRFSTPPSGGIAIQGRNLDVEVARILVSAQDPL